MHIFLGNLPVKVYQISAKYFTEKKFKGFKELPFFCPKFCSSCEVTQVMVWTRGTS